MYRYLNDLAGFRTAIGDGSMTRSGYLVAGALIFALAAAGVLISTNLLDLPLSLKPQTTEARLVAKMSDMVAGGGYAVTFSQADISKWRVGSGHQFERFSVEGRDAVFARLTSHVPLDTNTWEWSSQGLSTELPVQFNNQTNGQQIEIGIVARSSAASPAKTLSVVYATQQAGNSGWHQIALTSEFELRTFTFGVPKLDPGAYTAQPILVISADPSGNGAAAEILGAYIKQTR